MENMTNELKTTNSKNEVARKPYSTPKLREFGDVQSVVLAGSTGTSDGGAVGNSSS